MLCTVSAVGVQDQRSAMHTIRSIKQKARIKWHTSPVNERVDTKYEQEIQKSEYIISHILGSVKTFFDNLKNALKSVCPPTSQQSSSVIPLIQFVMQFHLFMKA
jgi:hypothetical protein